MQAVLQSAYDGTFRFGALTSREELDSNLAENGIPHMIFESGLDDFDAFLEERRKLMASIIRRYYERL